MIKLIINYGGTDHDYTRWLDFSSVSINEQINVPSQMTFKLTGWGGSWIAPPVRAYVRLISTKVHRALFSGFIAASPNIAYKGLATQGGGAPNDIQSPYPQMLEYDYIASSDEYLLNIKSVPFIPAFVNQTQGAILKQLAEILCPGYFDTSMVEDGDLVAYYTYDPSQSWSQIAKEFGDASRYRYHARDKQLVYAPYGDYLLGISYDELKGQGTFSPDKLNTTVLAVPVVNDVTIVGNAEGGNNREDYFIGDGFTTSFPLLHQVYQGSSTVLLQDDWTGNSLNTQNWFVQDPGDQFDYSVGALNVVSGFAMGLGTAYIAANNGIELAGGIDLEHGEVVFNDYSSGWIGAVYENAVFGATGMLCGFNISSPGGVILSASGASGVVMQPMWGASAVGPPIVSRFNHSYVLQTIFTAPAFTRWTQTYRTVAGDQYGAAETAVNGNVTFIIQDTDIGAATGVFYQPLVTKTTINNVQLPAFASYALVNNEELNITLNFTLLAQLPRQNLYCNVGPCGLFVPTGLILPMLPPGSGGYTGGVSPWPDAASGNIFFPPAGLQGWVQEVMGNGFENQAAQITSGQSADTLSFYIQTCPAGGTPIRLQSFENQAAVSRLRASGSIQQEAWAAGDDGLRSAIVTNLTPLPRTSEDCDNAALAFLTDKSNVFYNGSYTCTSLFLDQSTSDIQYWPTCGRYININSPARGLFNQESLVTAVGITILDAVTEVLQFAIQFGADLNLEKTLYNFVDIQQPNVLTNQDKANPPNPRYSVTIGNAQQLGQAFLPDLNNVQAFWITDDYVFIAVVDNYIGNIEVRQFDANFGTGDTQSGWIATYYVVGGPTGTYIPQFADQDNVDDLIANLNNTVPVAYGGGPDQINPEGYNSSFSTAIGNQYTGGREVPPLPPSGGVPGAPAPNGFILSRQQFDQLWYMRPVASGMTSRRSKVIRVRYPRKPATPRVISANSNFIQFDFNGDIRSIFGFELRVPHIDHYVSVIFAGHVTRVPIYGPDAIIVQKPVASYADLNIDLTQTPNGYLGPVAGNRVFKARFFNHQWSYSEEVEVTVPAPAPPKIEIGYRFGQSLDVLSDLDARIDIAAQRFQVYGPPGPPSGDVPGGQLIIDSQLNTQTANWTTNVPVTGDLWVRSLRADLIGSGDWCSPLQVPQGNFIASDYLAAQGSAPPVVTSGTGSIFTYFSADSVITVYVLPFEVVYPNQQLVNVLPVSGTFGTALDTGDPLVGGSGYLFYFSMESAAFTVPEVFIDGPYLNPSMQAIVNQQADGRLPLTNGPLLFFCSAASSGGAGGGGGGTTGGGGVCGVGSSLIEMGDGSSKTLIDLEAGEYVRSLEEPESIFFKKKVDNIEVWTVKTREHSTRVGTAHTFLTESGGLITLFELLDLYKFGRELPKVRTVSGAEEITSIEDGGLESVYLLKLNGPTHVYVLDGFYNHNMIVKDWSS